ncbi:MAG: hypothetical protein M1380_00085 [Chloroflexi bacterium]|nr:hypothetical protein [Chloroflexota bacterium]
MTATNHLGFAIKRSSIRALTFIPRYYNPEIADHLSHLETTHNLIVLGDLVRNGDMLASTGDEIGKMVYGTGTIPFIRTSDISNWEIKADPKQGVSEEVYRQYAKKQDVQAGDLFFVRDGTYLIGTSCLVANVDRKMLYQSHILKFRLLPKSSLTGPLLLALLSSPIVRRQIRAKQFTADIIDTIGNRYRELVLPIPRDPKTCSNLEQEVISGVVARAHLREQLRKIPLLAQGLILDLSEDLHNVDEGLSEPSGNEGFVIPHSGIRSNILIPRYYNPLVDQGIGRVRGSHDVVSLGYLVKQGILEFASGIEVGKMVYGTGSVPFVRTSDISNWELKGDPKQAVSEDLYDKFKAKLDVQAGDILVVRDGTYLVGTSCILTERDTKILYCGGLYKIRVRKPEMLDPYLLLALLNCPIVRRQMRSKQFTRDIIDTLGKRIFEVLIPVPKDVDKRLTIARLTRETVERRAALRDRAKQIALEVEGIEQADDEERELLETL